METLLPLEHIIKFGSNALASNAKSHKEMTMKREKKGRFEGWI